MKAEILFLGVLAALGSVAVFAASSFSPAGRRFPWLVTFILLGLVLLQGIRTARRATPQEPRLSRESLREFLRSHGAIFSWSAAGFFLVYLFGFIVGIFLLILGYQVQQRQKWPAALAYAAGMGLATYLGFQVGLQMHLYQGLVTELLGF